MASLTYSELNSLCTTVAAGSSWFPVYFGTWMEDLYNTGCRPYEMLTKDLWSGNDLDGYELQPLKGNSIRFFSSVELSLRMRRWIVGTDSTYDLITYSKMRTMFSRLTPYRQIFHDTKQMDLYCFRFRYVKALRIDGMTDAEIQAAMGWADIGMVGTYADADLTY